LNFEKLERKTHKHIIDLLQDQWTMTPWADIYVVPLVAPANCSEYKHTLELYMEKIAEPG
jgi:hypothetical protein